MDGGGDAADPPGQVGDGGTYLLLRSGEVVAAPAAGDGDPVPPQLIDQMAYLDTLDGKGQLQFPAGGGVVRPQMVLLQIFRQPKKGAKKEGAVPLSENGPCIVSDTNLFFYLITPSSRSRRTQSFAPWV